MAIMLTEKAASELRDFMQSQGKVDASLRVWVAGGGCSGLQYGMALDDSAPEDDDQVFEDRGVRIMIDAYSLSFMSGSSVDYVDEGMGGGFKIENPNAVNSCGCGSSFQTEGSGGACGSKCC